MKIEYKRFQEIIQASEEQPDQAVFLAEYGIPDWILSEVTDDEEKAVEMIKNIHHITHITAKNLITESGMSQTKFAARFMIPLRTVQNWVGGKRNMPRYEKFMFAMVLDLFGDLDIV